MPRPPGVDIPQLQGRAWDLESGPQTTQQLNATIEYQFGPDHFCVCRVRRTEGYAPCGAGGSEPTCRREWDRSLHGREINSRRPLYNLLPNVGNIARTESNSTMDYHSAQVTGAGGSQAGVEFLASYTFGKTLTDNLGYYGSTNTSGEGAYWQNAYDRRSNRGPAFFDVRHNFTVGGVWALPYGRGQKFGSSTWVVNAILGGWSANYFLAARGGFPMTVCATDRTGQAVRGNVRANRYRELRVNDAASTIDNFFGLPCGSHRSVLRRRRR